MDNVSIQITVIRHGESPVRLEPVSFFLDTEGSGVDPRELVVAAVERGVCAEGHGTWFSVDDINLSGKEGEREPGDIDLMDAVAMYAGVQNIGWTDDYRYHPPQGVSRVLAEFAMTVSGAFPRDQSQIFKPLVTELVNTECDETEDRRREHLAWSAARVAAVKWCSDRGRDAEAAMLRDFRGSLDEICDLVQEIRFAGETGETADMQAMWMVQVALHQATQEVVDNPTDPNMVGHYAAMASIEAGVDPEAILAQIRGAIQLSEH